MSVEVTMTLQVSVCQEFQVLLKMSIVKSTEMNYMYAFFLELVKTTLQFYTVHQMTILLRVSIPRCPEQNL